MATQLAATGYRGPRSVLEGPQGFLKTFARFSDVTKLTRSLGRSYEIQKHISFKPYACCSNIFAVIDAIKYLMVTAGLNADAVRKVVVFANRDDVQYHTQNTNISTIGAAQYSIPYAVAATLEEVIDDPALAFSETSIRNTRITSLCKKVTVRLDAKIDSLFPKYEAARVAVHMQNGKTLEKTVKYATGSPKRPLSQNDLDQKFNRLTKGVFPTTTAEGIRQMVSTLESSTDMRDLLRLLRVGRDVEGIQEAREHHVIANRRGKGNQTGNSKTTEKDIKPPRVSLV